MSRRAIRYAAVVTPFLLLALLPIGPKDGGMYNGISGALYCASSRACWHEIGHKMDDNLGYPSRSAEFGDTVRFWLILSMPMGLDDIDKQILFQDGLLSYSRGFTVYGLERFSSPQAELYANLFSLFEGNVEAIPEPFRKFYSADAKYTELHTCLMSAPLKLCGLALHREKDK